MSTKGKGKKVKVKNKSQGSQYYRGSQMSRVLNRDPGEMLRMLLADAPNDRTAREMAEIMGPFIHHGMDNFFGYSGSSDEDDDDDDFDDGYAEHMFLHHLHNTHHPHISVSYGHGRRRFEEGPDNVIDLTGDNDGPTVRYEFFYFINCRLLIWIYM